MVAIAQMLSQKLRSTKKWAKRKDFFSLLGYAFLSLGGYANIAYYQNENATKDVTISYFKRKNENLEIKNDSLSLVLEGQKRAINVLINNQVTGNRGFEILDNPAWLKIFNTSDGNYVITYLNEAYEVMLPAGMSRFELFGKTGHMLDIKFGNYYQIGDKEVGLSGESEIFPEPYQLFGKGAILCGRFLKGRVSKIGTEVTIYGIYIEDCSQKEKEVMLIKLNKMNNN